MMFSKLILLFLFAWKIYYVLKIFSMPMITVPKTVDFYFVRGGVQKYL